MARKEELVPRITLHEELWSNAWVAQGIVPMDPIIIKHPGQVENGI